MKSPSQYFQLFRDSFMRFGTDGQCRNKFTPVMNVKIKCLSFFLFIVKDQYRVCGGDGLMPHNINFTATFMKTE